MNDDTDDDDDFITVGQFLFEKKNFNIILKLRK